MFFRTWQGLPILASSHYCRVEVLSMNISRRTSVAGAVTAVVLVGGSAYAYFTSSSTGTAATSVGTASTWLVTGTGGTGSPAASAGSMYPGVGTLTVTYAAKNPTG